MPTTHDQARRLRELVRDTRSQFRASARLPAIVAVVRGCSSDRATSVALLLAEELTRKSVRVQFYDNVQLPVAAPPDVDIVVIDAGVGFTPHFASVWRQADLVLSIVSASRESLLAAYAAIKAASGERPDLPVHVTPFRCADEQESKNLHRRISQSCERFLGIVVPAAPWLPCASIDPTGSIRPEAIRQLAEYVRQVLAPAMYPEISLAG